MISLNTAETVAVEGIRDIGGMILIKENRLPQCRYAHDKWRCSQIPPLEKGNFKAVFVT